MSERLLMILLEKRKKIFIKRGLRCTRIAV